MPTSTRDFAIRVAIVVAIGAAVAAAWLLRDAELLLFGAVLFAILFDAAARLAAWLRPMPRGWALALAVSLVAIVLVGLLAFFGVGLEIEAADLVRRLPAAWLQFQHTLSSLPGGKVLRRLLAELNGAPTMQWLGQLRAYAQSAVMGAGDLVLMLAGGVYLAAQPRLYVEGLLRLLPEPGRELWRRALGECAALLARWFFAQLASMASVGILFGVGLWALGVPAAGALGVFAGLAEFIPLLGPIVAAIPALIIAAASGPYAMLGALGVYVGVHLIESNLLQPLLQRGMTAVPPVFILFALVVFWKFFGLLGVIFAAPLAIVCIVMVRSFWLHEATPPPGLWPRAPADDKAIPKSPQS